MHKYILISGIIALILGFMCLGYQCGIQHVIRDSDMFITEYDDPLEIYIELDGNVYSHIADIC